MIKSIIKNILSFINIFLLYRNAPRQNILVHSPWLIFKLGVIQRIFRINGHVPWPVHWTSQIKSPEKVTIGTRTPGLGLNCYIDGRNGIELGSDVWIGPRVSIISQNHDLYDYAKYISAAPIKIGDNSWIATNAIILPGVVLGQRTIVAAGAVVTKSYPDGFQVLAGNPARVLRKLNKR